MKHSATRSRFPLSLLLAGAFSCACSVFGADPSPAGQDLRFLARHSGEAYLLYFFGQDDDLQRERFVTEGALHLEFSLASWGGEDELLAVFHIMTGMGDSVTDNLPFSPKEMAYELSPVFQHLSPEWLWRLGWVHACQHLIYKDDDHPWYQEGDGRIPPDVYFNRLFAGIGSPESRPERFRQTFLSDAGSRPPPLFLGYVEVGTYLRSLGGLLDEDSLYGDNDWSMDLKADLGLPVWQGRSALLLAGSRTHLLFDTAGDACLRETLELSVHFTGAGYATSLNLGHHTVDEHPRDSKEGMWEVGIRFYF